MKVYKYRGLNDAARACRVQRVRFSQSGSLFSSLNDAARACRVQRVVYTRMLITLEVSMMQHARAECSAILGTILWYQLPGLNDAARACRVQRLNHGIPWIGHLSQ